LNNFNDDKNHIIDADFEEIDKDDLLQYKNINKEPLYYTRNQVAKMLNVKESTVSYWSKEFQPLLKLKIINMIRRYTKQDVQNLMFIQRLLKEDGLTVQQAFDYCSEKGFDNEKGLIDQQNPLAVQTFISAMTVEFDKKVAEMQNGIIAQQQQMINSLQQIILTSNEDLRKEINLTVDETITEKMNEFKEEYTKEMQENNKLTQMSYDLLAKQEQRKKESEEKNQQKSIFAKIESVFNKKK
jgi:DNA-binding transcriptional MerR regulator